MFHRTRIILILLTLLFVPVAVYAVWQNNIPLISPIAMVEAITGHTSAAKSSKIVYGFFPYWNTKYANELNINYLTHFAYFAIDLNPDGTIYKLNSKKEQEPGWNKLNSSAIAKLLFQSKLLGQKTVLTTTAMDPDLITSILDSEASSTTAINSITEVYQKFNFDDINVDFEYVGEPSNATRNNFVTFIKNLKARCLQINKDCRVDIDIFGDTAAKKRLWDLEQLSPIVDRFIVMTYDYYRKTSTQAGPVAPLTGKCKTNNGFATSCLDLDIVTHIALITKIVPSEKIILGIPFYGYEWQTASKDFLANTYPRTGSMASYARIQSLFSDPNISSLSATWSETTLSPYLVFEVDKEIHQIHYEDQESLKQKIMLVNSANLGGIAIWAIGYETPYNDIWNPIKDLFTL